MTTTRIPVPARGAQRRLRALNCRGWSAARLAAELDVHESTIETLLHGEGGWITNVGHAVVANLFNRLWDQEPPCSTAAQRLEVQNTISRALDCGWVPPMAWDDIDHDESPAAPGTEAEPIIDDIAIEQAIGGARIRLTTEERATAVQRLHEDGWTATEIARVLHANYQSTCNILAAYAAPILTEAA